MRRIKLHDVRSQNRRACGYFCPPAALMRPSRVQLICRSHNCFSPSIALWQHFVVAPGPVRLSRRLLSSAPPRTDDDAPLERPVFRKMYMEDDQRLELSRLASVPRPFPSVPYPTRSLAPEVTPEQAEALHAKTRGRGSRPRPVAVAPYQLPSTITPIEDKNLPWFLPNRVDNSVKYDATLMLSMNRRSDRNSQGKAGDRAILLLRQAF